MNKIFRYLLNRIPRPALIKLSYLLRPVLAFFLRGNRYTDPIDGRSFRKFLPYGYEKPRENVLSPSTLSLERHRLLWLFLKNKSDFRAIKNELDKLLLFLGANPIDKVDKAFREKYKAGILEYLDLAS